MRILDLSPVPPPPSSFDDSEDDGDDWLRFFGEYVERITRPVILDGNHPVDYAPTQVLTEFFRWATNPRLDGIAYPSRVSDGGTNVVLFLGDRVRFEERGSDSGRMPRPLRSRDPGAEEPALIVDPKTVRKYRVERTMTVTCARF